MTQPNIWKYNLHITKKSSNFAASFFAVKYVHMPERTKITHSVEGIYKDKGSKFISFVEPIESEEQAKARIAWYKKKYHDARHVCYAYRLGENLWRTKDDGEPHGTAGAPILRTLDANNLDYVLAVVVRYFGGTLLGTGGLMVAYREATKDAVDKL